MSADDLIRLEKATKTYRGVPAIQDIDFSVRRNEVHALLGENGAGKSTLSKIIAGVTPLTSGRMLLENAPVSFATPSEALARGIAMVFQETSLVPSMTVAQNLYLGEEKLFNRLRGLYIAAQQFLQTLNFNVDPWATVSTLGAAQKQMVEIARAVHHNARLIIFDEPTATLTPEERKHFFALLDRLKARGVAVIFISHALEDALTTADRITVLRDGKMVRTGNVDEFDRASIIQAMVGRDLTAKLYESGSRKVRPPGERMLSVQNLSWGKVVRNNSFSVYRGQVTGLFGLIGSGRTETAKIVSGIEKRDFFHGGEVKLGGRPVRYRVPRPAVKDGIVYVTEDRKAEGFYETMSIAENLHSSLISAGLGNRFVVSFDEMRSLARTWIEKLSIRAMDSSARVIELSGGNQQKVVIADALVQVPQLVILDEPTRGVDVGAIAEIHDLINELADSGLAVLVISSYLPEILSISDRILVCRQGRVVEEFSPTKATEEKIMYAAVH